MKLLLFFAVLLQWTDAVTFVAMGGLAYELNPIVHALGFEKAIILKAALIVLIPHVWYLLEKSGKYRRVGVFMLVMAVVFGLIGTTSNILVMVL